MKMFKRFFGRFVLRLIYWAEKPLPHEEVLIHFRAGGIAEHNRMLREYPILEVRPYPYNTTKPLSMRQRAAIRKLRTNLVPLPEKGNTLPPQDDVYDTVETALVRLLHESKHGGHYHEKHQWDVPLASTHS